MSNNQHINASSLSAKERQRIINRIEQRICFLITPVNENEYLDPQINTIIQDSFNDKLKRKLAESTIDPTIKTPSKKVLKPTINRYFPVNIATLNVRGLNDQVKQHQILDYLAINHLDIIGLIELHIINKNYSKHPH